MWGRGIALQDVDGLGDVGADLPRRRRFGRAMFRERGFRWGSVGGEFLPVATWWHGDADRLASFGEYDI